MLPLDHSGGQNLIRDSAIARLWFKTGLNTVELAQSIFLRGSILFAASYDPTPCLQQTIQFSLP